MSTETKTEPRFHVLECEAHGCTADFWLNGIPIIRRGPEHGPAFNAPLNQYMLDGENEIEIVIRPGPIPSQSRAGEFGPRQLFEWKPEERAFARLARYPKGAVVNGPDAVEMMRLEWPRRDATLLHADGPLAQAYRDRKLGHDDHVPGVYPLVIRKKANLGRMYGRWSWQDAPVLDDGPDLRAEVLTFLTELRLLINAGDSRAFLRLSRPRLDDIESAYGTPASQHETFIKRGMAQDSKRPGWALEPLLPDALDLRVVAGGRLVECVALDGRPALRELPDADGLRSYYPMLLCKLDGGFRIVR